MTVAHKWVAGAVALALVVGAGAWFLLIAPKRSEAADLQSQAAAQADENASLQTQVNVLREQKKDLPKQQAKLAALRTDIPQTDAMPALIREVNATAEKAGVDVLSLAPTDAVTVLSAEGAVDPGDGTLTPGGLAAIDSQLVVEGGYFEIMKFVGDLETLDRYLLVTGLAIAEDEGAADASATEESQGLTATIGARVFLLPSAAEVVTDESTDTATASQ
jgi:type IV pilus assembly protein PilO